MARENLTPKQERFVEEYCCDLNATQSAIRAGYSERTARAQGAENLTKPDIQKAISRRAKELQDAVGLTPERAAAELARLALADMGHYASWGPDGVKMVPSKHLPEGSTAAVAEVTEHIGKDGARTVRFKLHDKGAALDRWLKFWQWRHEVNLDERLQALEERLKEGLG
jgi:phage terminase small subunit